MQRAAPGLLSISTLLAMLVLGAGPAAAGDGVLEINQTCATQGGCFPGDASGFPVQITAPGSYRLTSSLSVTGNDVIGVRIDADDVTLDLSGFTIGGPLSCSGSPPSCAGGRTGAGIFSDVGLRQSVTVKNGFVEGMGGGGIDLVGVRIRVEGVDVRENGGVGIRVGSVSIVANCVAWLNESDGVQVSSASLVRDSVLAVNGRWGIFASFAGSAGYTGNVFNSNSSGTANGLIEFGENVCNGNTTCP